MKTKLLKLTAIMLIIAGVFTACSCIEIEKSLVPVTNITLNKSSLVLAVGETEMLVAIVAPENATNKTITWTSNNENVATVDENGKVTAISAGIANITAQADEETVVCEVTIISNSLDGVVIGNIRWATRNVDAPGTFADNPESSGMLFQWNRRQDWSATVPGRDVPIDGWNSTPAEGTTWYAENDPCPPGWRVPTEIELNSLINAGSIWLITGSIWTTLNGIEGGLFGTAPYQIFLPVIWSRRASDGSLIYFTGDAQGFYWSSTTFLFHKEIPSLLIQKVGRVVTNSPHRGFAHSVRCVAD